MVAVLLAATAIPVRAIDLFLPADPAVEARIVELQGRVSFAGEPPLEIGGPALRSRPARIDLALLERTRDPIVRGAASADLLDLNLFEDARFRATNLAVRPTSSGWAFSANLEGDPFGVMALVVNGDAILGSVRAADGLYMIERAPGDGHVLIRQVDEPALPACGGAIDPAEPPDASAGPAGPVAAAAVDRHPDGLVARQMPRRCTRRAPCTVDVLAAYTPAAGAVVGGLEGMETLVDWHSTNANIYFAESGTNIRVNVVHIVEADYEETPTSFDLYPLRLPRDGKMDELLSIRDAVGADVVHLFERWGEYCGIAYRMSTVGPAFASTAFGLTNVRCGPTTFAHELGHNLGLQHDRFTVFSGGAFSNEPHVGSYGYVNEDVLTEAALPRQHRWSTIMAYGALCRHMGYGWCWRVGRFSDPAGVHLHGDRLGVDSNDDDTDGVTGPADAVATLRTTGRVVEAFRSRPASLSVIRLKRTSVVAAGGPGETPKTKADSLGWRIAFARDARNVDGGDFSLGGASLASPTITATPVRGSRKVFDLAASGGGIADADGEVTLSFAPGRDVTDAGGAALNASWPGSAERSYVLDNTPPTATIRPSGAGASPFTMTVRWNEDVSFSSGDVSVSNASISWLDASNRRVQVAELTPADAGAASTIVVRFGGGAARDALGHGAAPSRWNISYDPATGGRSLSIGGLGNASAAENGVWTSPAPTVSGNPVGTLSWTVHGSRHFSVDASTGVLTLAPRDYENPDDLDGDGVYEATVRVTDENGNAAAAAVEVAVTDVVETRELDIAGVGDSLIPENFEWSRTISVRGGFVCSGGVCRVEDGPVGTARIRLRGADAGAFSLSENGTLALSFAPDFENPADANGDGVYELTLRAEDEDGNTRRERMGLWVYDQFPRPLRIDAPDAAPSVVENAVWRSGGAVFSGVPQGDVDWSKSGADAHLFTLDPGGGLSLPARDFESPADANGDNVYEVTLRLNDGEGNAAERNIGLTVTDVNEGSPPPSPTPPPPPPPTPPPPPSPTPPPPPSPTPPPPPAEELRAGFTVDAKCGGELCRVRTGERVGFRDTSTGTVRGRRWDFGDGGPETGAASLRRAWSTPGFFVVTLTVNDGVGESAASKTFLVEAAEPRGSCVGDDATRCLRDSRYAVEVGWLDVEGERRAASVVHAGTNDSALFRFADRDNWEVLVKVLDGCEVNGHDWVFAASATDLGHFIRVTDTAAEATREYGREAGVPVPAITDVGAFSEACEEK